MRKGLRGPRGLLFDRLESKDRAVGRAAAVPDLGREVDQAVGSLDDVAEAHAELGQHWVALLGLAAAAEDDALHLLTAQRRHEQVVTPLGKARAAVEREARRA